MFRLALALLLGLTTMANAQDSKYFFTRQECDTAQRMLSIVTNQWGETALFTGSGIQFDQAGTPYTGATMLTVNQETGTWSLITMYGNGMACMTSVGTDFEPYSQ